jgi:hypothetical protein
MTIPGQARRAIAPSDRDLRRLIFSARGLRAGGGTMEQGGPPQSSPHVRTDGAPAGPGCPPTGPRTLGKSARFVSYLAPARSRPAPRPAEQARNVDLLERARREPHGTRNASGGHRSRGHLAVRRARAGRCVRGADRGGRRARISPSRAGTSARRGGKRRAKTDREDARGLRPLPADRRPPEARIPPAQVRDLRRLVHRGGPRADIPAGGVRRAAASRRA